MHMKKILFIFGLLFFLAGCEPAPTLDVIGYGVIEYDEVLDDYFVKINDRTIQVNQVLSYRSGDISFDKPVVGQEVMCYKMSHKDKYYFAYSETDIEKIESQYSPRFAGMDIGLFFVILFAVFIFFMVAVLPELLC